MTSSQNDFIRESLHLKRFVDSVLCEHQHLNPKAIIHKCHIAHWAFSKIMRAYKILSVVAFNQGLDINWYPLSIDWSKLSTCMSSFNLLSSKLNELTISNWYTPENAADVCMDCLRVLQRNVNRIVKFITDNNWDKEVAVVYVPVDSTKVSAEFRSYTDHELEDYEMFFTETVAKDACKTIQAMGEPGSFWEVLTLDIDREDPTFFWNASYEESLEDWEHDLNFGLESEGEVVPC